MLSFIRKFSFITLMSILSIAVVLAQSAACPELVQTALASVSNSCANLGRNELCYGYDQVQASFLNEVPEDYFDTVADKSPVDELATLQTFPMNSATGEWGVAVMNLQANLPNTLPGQNVTFVLMGDVEVENAVAPEDVFVPSDGIEITLAVESANLRSGAGLNFNVVGGLRSGESIIADGISEDGEWLRVVRNNRPAWLNRALVSENPEIDSLPVLTDELTTPMQSFYLRTGLGQPECVEAPEDLLLVQGPENIQVQITVNGASIGLGSSGALRVIEINGEPYLEITVFDGEFEADGTIIRAGQRSVLCLGDENSRGMDGEDNDLVVTCGASRPEYIPNFGSEWCLIENVPGDILNYKLDILCPGETPAPTGGSTNASDSQLAAVDCSSFGIITSDIPATSFLLEWTAASGADTYEVAIFDSSGYQTALYTGITGTSIGLNGGQGFASAGRVDVRAYRGGEYACFTSLNFTRSADPNEVVGGGIVINCSWAGAVWSIDVTWTDQTPPVDVSWSGSSSFPISDSQSFFTANGSYNANPGDSGPGTMVVIVSTGGGNNVSRNC